MPINALTRIDEFANTAPDHVAVIFEDRITTYGELVSESFKAARKLFRLGIVQGQRVCIFSSNCPEYYAVYLAVLRCGCTLFPINSELQDQEIAHILDKAKPVLVITGENEESAFKAACGKRDIDARTMNIRELFQDDEDRDDHSDITFPQRQTTDLAVVIHTSGTTALPKGVPASDVMEVVSALALTRPWQLSSADISVCALPLSYTFGLFTASFVALTHGASILLFKKFNPVRVLEGIEKHGATYMVGVPAMYAMMVAHIRETGKTYELGSMRFVASSGAPIAGKIKEDFRHATGIPLLEYYALSECTPIFSFDLNSGESTPPASSGKLVPGVKVKIVDEEYTELPPGQTGMLLIRSARLMEGYYQDPERNAEAFVDGWFKTGDLAYQGPQGYFYVVGRLRDQVISGGHKISTAEVEGTILHHPGVAAVAVVGSPDDILGEVVRAVIVPKDGCTLTPESVIAFCRERLAAFKIPKLVDFRESLPTSPAGKVLKKLL
jgi:long-chain acyl-CoA synthetase